jgi:predicted MFS family arabinose efflux permease
MSQFISMLGSSAAPIALAFAVLDGMRASATDLGLVLLSRTAAQIVFVLFGGVLADRFPRRRIMLVAEVLAGVSQAVAATLVIAGASRIGWFAALSAVNGAAAALFGPATVGFVAQTVGAEHRQSANALLRASINLSSILGAVVAASLVATVGPGWALALDAASFFLSGALLLGIAAPGVAVARRAPIWRELRDGWSYFIGQTWLWVVVAQFAILNACSTGAIGVLGPVIADRQQGGATAWSIILGARSAGYLVGSLVALRVRPGRPLYLGVALTLTFALPLVLLGFAPPLPVIAAAMFVRDVCGSVFSVLWVTSLQRYVPDANLSRASAFDSLGSYVLGPLGLACVGPLADRFGTATTLIASGCLCFVTSCLALAVRQVRHR